MHETRSCVIVGAGMAGLTAASLLQECGWDVTLLDKGKGAGGRMATRRSGDLSFDYGAQFFTVRDSRFESAVHQWLRNGWARPWFSEGGHTRYCGTEGMRSLATHLAQPLDCRSSTKVIHMEHAGKSWRISTDGGAEFSAGSVLLTAPAPQSLDLLGADGANLLPAGVLDAVRNITFDPCLAVMVSLAGPGRIPAPGFVRPREGPVAFIADNARKGISGSDVNALTIHASPGFSRSSVDTPREETVAALLSAADPWLGSPVLSEESHFWKYSQPVVTWPEACLFTAQPAPLAFAGDAFAGARIEGAFLSGLAAAQRIMGI